MRQQRQASRKDLERTTTTFEVSDVFVPEAPSSAMDGEMPTSIEGMLEVQRQQLLGYLRAAQQAGRLDEVRMLQAQLRELEAFAHE